MAPCLLPPLYAQMVTTAKLVQLMFQQDLLSLVIKFRLVLLQAQVLRAQVDTV